MLHELDDQQRSVRERDEVGPPSSATPSQIPSALAEAWASAPGGPGRPVWVEIPQDVLLEPTHVPPVHGACDVDPPSGCRAPELIDAAAALLADAARPVILAGGGVRPLATAGGQRCGASRSALDAPVVSTVGGKGAIAFDHPLSAASWIEDRHTTDLLEDADVLLAVGTAMGEVTRNYFTFAPRGRVIQIDAEPRRAGVQPPGARHPRRRRALAPAGPAGDGRRTRGRGRRRRAVPRSLRDSVPSEPPRRPGPRARSWR